MTATLRGKPDAGNPHVRFDEGEVASAKLRCGSLLYRTLLLALVLSLFVGAALADMPALTAPRGRLELGYMLDVSRNKVPTIETLCRIADILAELGFTQFQLYTEHTFAYAGHEEVWKDASPVTPADVRRLDEHCHARGIELIPNQNSFGHMDRWFRHAAYRALAEAPDGPVYAEGHPWNGAQAKPRALCPTDPAATNFLAGLYAQLLPCFRHTRLFNAGCDEVFDINPGVRSAEAVRTRGESAVFREHFANVRRLAAAHGKPRVQYWADHLLRMNGEAGRLPEGGVALVYMYEAEYPFLDLARKAHERGAAFYVAPGTSGWGSLFGRYWNMKGNVAGAFEAARAYGAEGVLLCDWGDYGHPQPFLVALPALVNVSLRAKGVEPTDAAVVREIDRVTGATCGETLLALGDLYRLTYWQTPNVSPLLLMLCGGRGWKVPWTWKGDGRMDDLFDQGRAALGKLRLDGAPAWVKDDCALLALFLEATELAWKRDFDRIRREMPPRYRELWLRQNRPGGLEESVRTLFLH